MCSGSTGRRATLGLVFVPITAVIHKAISWFFRIDHRIVDIYLLYETVPNDLKAGVPCHGERFDSRPAGYAKGVSLMSLLARSPDGFSRESISQFLPWLTHVTPDLVLCKDGSLLSAFEFSSVDIDEDNPLVIEQAVRELQNSLQSLDERFYIWWVIDKKEKT